MTGSVPSLSEHGRQVNLRYGTGNNMRTALVTGLYPAEKMGGVEYRTLLMAQGLAELGHDVVFLAASSHEERKSKAGKTTVAKLPGWRTIGRALHRRLVSKALQEGTPEVSYVRMFDELATIVPFCKELPIPVVSASRHSIETSPLLLG
jgi:hypothetical protein